MNLLLKYLSDFSIGTWGSLFHPPLQASSQEEGEDDASSSAAPAVDKTKRIKALEEEVEKKTLFDVSRATSKTILESESCLVSQKG